MQGSRALLLLAVVGAAVALAERWHSSSAPPATPSTASSGEAAAAPSRWTTLPERPGLSEHAIDLFSPPAPMSAAAGGTAPSVQAAPAAPAMPYRLAGRLKLQDRVHAVLAKDKDVVVALQGQKLEDGYRVESIRPDSVTLLYPPKERTKLPFDLVFVPQQQRAYEVGRGAQPIAAQPVTSQPAQLPSVQLRLEGPPQVKAGAPFIVTVKASASEPLSAVPLQLTYDPAVLQLTSMKAGGFFDR